MSASASASTWEAFNAPSLMFQRRLRVFDKRRIVVHMRDFPKIKHENIQLPSGDMYYSKGVTTKKKVAIIRQKSIKSYRTGT